MGLLYVVDLLLLLDKEKQSFFFCFINLGILTGTNGEAGNGDGRKKTPHNRDWGRRSGEFGVAGTGSGEAFPTHTTHE